MDLEFGRCKLQVQVPERGELQTPESLIGKNVVTSFTNLATAYFRELEAKHTDKTLVNGDAKDGLRTHIKYVGGSVEAACALGVADGIVDLVGRTASRKRTRQVLTIPQNLVRLCEQRD